MIPMIDIYSLLLLSITLIVEISLFTCFFDSLYLYSKFHAPTRLWILLLLFSFGIGILGESLQNISVILFNVSFTPFIEAIFFLKRTLGYIGGITIIQLAYIYIRKAGFSLKYTKIMRNMTGIVVPFFVVINLFTSVPFPINEYGLSQCQISILLIPILYLVYIPVTSITVYNINKIIKEIQNQKTAKVLRFLVFSLILLAFSEIITSHSFYMFGNGIYSHIFNYSLRLAYSLCLLVIISKYRYFLDLIETYFDLRAIYVISKGGITMFEYKFEHIGRKPPINKKLIKLSEMVVLGGFVYVIAKGFEQMMNIAGEIRSLQIGDMTIYFAFGESIFSILFTTQENNLLRDKLQEYVEKIEEYNNGTLKNWNRAITEYIKPDNIMKRLVNQIFR